MARKYIARDTSEYHKKLMGDFLVRLEKLKDFIRAYWEKEHYSPSIAEIKAEFHTSTSHVSKWLDRLEKDGWIEKRKPGVARNIVPVEIFAGRDVFLTNIPPNDRDFSHPVPFEKILPTIDGEFPGLDEAITTTQEKP